MKPLIKLSPLLLGGALVSIAADPAAASVATITDIEINPTAGGLEIVLDADGSENADIFTVSRGNFLQADITRTQLRLSDSREYTQQNPAPGIASITLAPLDANSVRLTVEGTGDTPVSIASNSSGGSLVLAVQTSEAAAETTVIPDAIETVPAPEIAQAEADPAPEPPPQEIPTPAPASPTDVLVPDPDVTIDGVPVTPTAVPVAPPFLPRAIAPPVGDIAFAELAVQSQSIDLGSGERIPRLVLRNAPAREVLSLLARAANLNLVFTAEVDGVATDEEGEGPAITLDIVNESVQDVFNHVLRVSGLQANRVGRSIYVGPQLPDGARNITSRTLRLNQASAVNTAGFLASLGAEATQIVTTTEIETVTVEGATDGVPAITRVIETESTDIEQLTYDPDEDTRVAQPLSGLQVITDERLNTVTLVGEATLVELGTRYAAQLDLRRRQVAINVRIIDVNLNATDSFGVSFSYINRGFSLISGGTGALLGINTDSGNSAGSSFLINLNAAIQNQDAKILTDPTLVIQEGQTANVALVENVLTSVESQINPETGAVTSITPVFEEAGLQLAVQVETIDDNGFVTFNVTPSVSAPQPAIIFSDASGNQQQLTPLQRREVSSGSIRVRDSQTLVLAGIIQDADRVTTTKVPILGDIPLLGALFRTTTRTNERNEVIVLLTPEILDDSDSSVYGYSYVPSEDVQDLLEEYR